MRVTEPTPGLYQSFGGELYVLRFIARNYYVPDERVCILQNQTTGAHFIISVSDWLQPMANGQLPFTPIRGVETKP